MMVTLAWVPTGLPFWAGHLNTYGLCVCCKPIVSAERVRHHRGFMFQRVVVAPGVGSTFFSFARKGRPKVSGGKSIRHSYQCCPPEAEWNLIQSHACRIPMLSPSPCEVTNGKATEMPWEKWQMVGNIFMNVLGLFGLHTSFTSSMAQTMFGHRSSSSVL